VLRVVFLVFAAAALVQLVLQLMIVVQAWRTGHPAFYLWTFGLNVGCGLMAVGIAVAGAVAGDHLDLFLGALILCTLLRSGNQWNFRRLLRRREAR